MRSDSHRIDHALAEDFARSLPDDSVDLIVTDPPYFRMKDAPWDRAWNTADGFLSWLGGLADEWRRVLKPNGTLYVFASPRMAARVEVMLGERFEVIASPVWVKDAGWHQKSDRDALRSFHPQTERVSVCEQFGADSTALGGSGYAAKCDELRGFVFEPLRAYLDGERERAGYTPRQVNEALGNQMAGHYFTQSQWALPTEPNYEAMRALFNRSGGDYLRREYDDLRREYDDLRREFESLRRPFDATQGQHFTDVWTYPTVAARPGKHPCEKPVQMAEDIVRVSSRPGALVLDTFCGSGVFLEAAARLGRIAWGCDADPKWAAHAARVVGTEVRCDAPVREIVAASRSMKPKPVEDLPLFRGCG